MQWYDQDTNDMIKILSSGLSIKENIHDLLLYFLVKTILEERILVSLIITATL